MQVAQGMLPGKSTAKLRKKIRISKDTGNSAPYIFETYAPFYERIPTSLRGFFCQIKQAIAISFFIST